MDFRLLKIAFVACALTACSTASDGGQSLPPPPGELVRSDKPRLAASAPAEDVAQLTTDNADFAFDVLGKTPASESFFFSPHSISIALAMTYGGARERTASQMAEALHFTLPPERLHAAFGTLDLDLAARSEAHVESGEAFRLNVLNSLWGERGYKFLSTYLDLLAENYGAGLSLLDFAADPEGSRKAINDWVSTCTETRIPELLPEGTVTSATVLVLTNAIYFKASWKTPFKTEKTTDGTFTKLDGTTSVASFMHEAEELRYADGDDYQALELPYAGDDVSMLVILPAQGHFEDFRAKLDAAHLSQIVGALGPRWATVTFPRFELRTKLGVKSTLQSLGMVDAFEGGVADFSGMDGTRTLFVQDVVHEAFVAVDEHGTEAAAATAVVVGRVSALEPATFAADRPFFVLVRDNPTGAVLFLGQVTDVASGS